MNDSHPDSSTVRHVLIKLFALRLSITFLIQARFGSPCATVLIFSGLSTQDSALENKCSRPTRGNRIPGEHSLSVPPVPISNTAVKRLTPMIVATAAKVGHCRVPYNRSTPVVPRHGGCCVSMVVNRLTAAVSLHREVSRARSVLYALCTKHGGLAGLEGVARHHVDPVQRGHDHSRRPVAGSGQATPQVFERQAQKTTTCIIAVEQALPLQQREVPPRQCLAFLQRRHAFQQLYLLHTLHPITHIVHHCRPARPRRAILFRPMHQ
jgi:hypothetical protein